MNVGELRRVLAEHPNARLRLTLPDATAIPEHFHITEVGRVQKNFIDCGGTRRTVVTCLLQAWVANDTHHRLSAGRLADILQLAAPILESDDLPTEVEYQSGQVAQFAVTRVDATADELVILLRNKQTECLAPDRCGLEVLPSSTACCSPSDGCC